MTKKSTSRYVVNDENYFYLEGQVLGLSNMQQIITKNIKVGSYNKNNEDLIIFARTIVVGAVLTEE